MIPHLYTYLSTSSFIFALCSLTYHGPINERKVGESLLDVTTENNDRSQDDVIFQLIIINNEALFSEIICFY